MKRTLLSIALVSLVFAGCKKDDDPVDTPSYKCTTCKSTPDALAANNASSAGIYKGIFIGSTGTIMFNIANGGTAVNASMVINGVAVNLTSSVIWVSGQPYAAPFTGTFNGAPITVNFAVGLSGGTPTVTSSNIPGHPNASFTVVKETSTDLVEAFEGSYTTTLPENGTFNMLVFRSLNKFGGKARKMGGAPGDDSNFNGTLTGDKLYMPVSSPTNIVHVGTFNVDQLNGSFQDSNGRTITITGRRTL